MQLAQSLDSIGKRALAGYLALWGASTAYLALRGADWTFPVVSLLLFACTFGALGWFLTRKSDAPPVAVTAPRFQVAVLLAYLAIYAFVLVGWGLGAIKELVPPGAMREWLVLAYKLLIHVALPAALIAWAGGALADTFDPGLRRKGVVPALLILSGLMFGLLAVVSPSLAELAELGVTGGAILPWVLASWLWMAIEAGLCEEYLFRAGLQSSLAAWLRSPLAAILIASVIFALMHWPGLYLRGGPGTDGWSTDPLEVAAFCIASLSPIAVLFGVLWARTRSLLLLIVVHGAVDALPNAAEMFRAFT